MVLTKWYWMVLNGTYEMCFVSNKMRRSGYLIIQKGIFHFSTQNFALNPRDLPLMHGNCTLSKP